MKLVKSQKHSSTPLLRTAPGLKNHILMVALVAFVVATGYLAVHFTLASSCTVSVTLVNSCRPWIGAAVSGDPAAAGDPISQFNYLESQIGHPLDIFHDYHTVGSLPLDASDIYYINRTSTYAYIDWKPTVKWADADGRNVSVNAAIKLAADTVKAAAPHKIFLSVWHEPELDVSGGTTCATTSQTGAGTPAQYRAMWQNVRSIFDAAGVTNVVWVMNYTGDQKWDCLIPQLWPGNNLVDWVTFDVYGTDQTPTWSSSVGRIYNVLTTDSSAVTDFAAKPWGAAEFGTCQMTNLEAANSYYASAKAAVDTNTYPRIKMYLVYDDTQNHAGSGCLTDRTPGGAYDGTKQAAFKQFADDPVFTASYTPPSSSGTISPTGAP